MGYGGMEDGGWGMDAGYRGTLYMGIYGIPSYTSTPPHPPYHPSPMLIPTSICSIMCTCYQCLHAFYMHHDVQCIIALNTTVAEHGIA